MGTEERNMELMQTLDDAWNAQDLGTFAQRHKTDVVVRWPGKPPMAMAIRNRLNEPPPPRCRRGLLAHGEL